MDEDTIDELRVLSAVRATKRSRVFCCGPASNQVKDSGLHRVRVYDANDEYAQIYATRQHDSRDWNEPFSGVHGALIVVTEKNGTPE